MDFQHVVVHTGYSSAWISMFTNNIIEIHMYWCYVLLQGTVHFVLIPSKNCYSPNKWRINFDEEA